MSIAGSRRVVEFFGRQERVPRNHYRLARDKVARIDGAPRSRSALRVHLSLKIERVGDCVRTDVVVLNQIFEVQRAMVLWSDGGLQGGARVQRLQVWGMDGGGLLTGEKGDVVIVIIWRCRAGSDVSVFILSSVVRGCSSSVAGASVYESGRKPIVILLMCQAELLASLLLCVGRGQSGFHVSICPRGLLLTFVVRCDMTRCLLRTAGFV